MKQNKKLLKSRKSKKKTTINTSNDKSKNIPAWKKEMIEKLTIMSIKNKREQEKLCQNLD